jgi:hypothetical protein
MDSQFSLFFSRAWQCPFVQVKLTQGNTLNRTTMATWKSKPWQTRVQLPSSPYGTGYGVLGLGLKTKGKLGFILWGNFCVLPGQHLVLLGVTPTKAFVATRCCVEVALGVTPTFSFGTIWCCPKTSFDPWEALRQLGIVLGVILCSWAMSDGKNLQCHDLGVFGVYNLVLVSS